LRSLTAALRSRPSSLYELALLLERGPRLRTACDLEAYSPSFRYRVRRVMPNTLAAAALFPPCASTTR
jgi:hypothetical protein